MNFYTLLEDYGENLINLSKLLIAKEIKEKKIHFISYPFRRKETPQKIKSEEIFLNEEIHTLNEEIESLNNVVKIQKLEIKSLSEENK